MIMSSVLNILSLKCLTGNLSGDLWVRPQRDIWVCIEGLSVIFTDMAVKAKDETMLPRVSVSRPGRKGMRQLKALLFLCLL